MKTLYKLFAAAAAMFLSLGTEAQLSAPIDFPLPSNISAADVSAAEWYFDNDPGLGNGTSIPITGGSDVTKNNFAVAIDTLSTGAHRLYVRVKNTKAVWSLANEANFFIIPQGMLFPENTAAVNISAAEYYFDTDPGFGKGVSIPITLGSNVSVNNVAINIDTLSTGAHHLYVRLQNTNGSWSLSNVANLYIVQGGAFFPANPGTTNISAAEYFLDNDPGFGNGTSIPLTEGGNVSANDIAVNISSLAPGVHHIYVRAQNTNSNWSIANLATFYIVPVSFSIPPKAVAGNITALEYFFDTDPGFGNGTMISIPPTTDLNNYQIVADISGLQQDTIHTLYVRALDGWSQTNSTTFKISTAMPVTWLSFTGKMQSDHTALLQWQTATEQNSSYFSIERSTDGRDFASIGKVAAAGNSSGARSYTFTDMQPLQGNVYYRIKQVDADGKFIYSSVLQISTVGGDGFYIINNPARSELRVHTGGGQGVAQMQLFDMNGRMVMRVPVTTNDIQQIDISRLQPSVYIIRYAGADKIVSKKFIKR